MRTFAIASLPRSRTAWLSAWLTDGDSFCQHDMLRKGPPSDWRRLLALPGRAYCGVADAALPAMLDEAIRAGLLDGPVLIVTRPRFDVQASLERAGIGHDHGDYLDAAQRGLERIAQRGALVVPYHEISANLRAIWTYLLPGKPFDPLRAAEFDRLNIQVPEEHLLRGAWRGWMEE